MESKDGYQIRTEKKKEKILEAARQLFFSQGPGATPVSQIATAAAVSQVSIYNYFGSKDRLVEIIIREHLDRSIEKAEAILDLEIPFKEKLERFFSLGNDEANKTDDRLLARFDWHSSVRQETYARFVAERQVPFLIRFIEQGKAEEAVNPKLSTEAVMAYFNANMAIYKDPDLLKKGKEYLSSLSHLFFYGILGK